MSGQFDPYHTWLGIVPDGTPLNHYKLLGVPAYTGGVAFLTHAAHSRVAYLLGIRTIHNAALVDRLHGEILASLACLCDPSAKAYYDQLIKGEAPTSIHLPSPIGAEHAIAVPSIERPCKPNAVDSTNAPEVPTIAAATLSPRRRRNDTTLYVVSGVVAATTIVGVMLIGSTNDSKSPLKRETSIAKKSIPSNSPRNPVIDNRSTVKPQNEPHASRRNEEPIQSDAVRLSSKSTAEPIIRRSMEDTIAEVKKSIVRVEQGRIFGSGVVVDSSGIIATNFHVIEGARTASVVFANKSTFNVLGFTYYSQEHDLCLLKIDPKDIQLVALPLADKLPVQGMSVLTFGNPGGLEFTVTKGIVSGITTTEDLNILANRSGLTLGIPGNAKWIQTDAAIAGGNSGGPLLSENGTVYGLNTFVLKTVSNAFFANTSQPIAEALSARNRVRSLSDLPGVDQSKATISLGPPAEVANELNKAIQSADYGIVIRTMIAHREQALLNAKIVAGNSARDMQKMLADVETAKTSILELLNRPALVNLGGKEFIRYLLLIKLIDESIETSKNIEKSADALATIVAGSSDEMSKITAACILHRLHVRESSRSRFTELLTYLEANNNYATATMLEWYTKHYSRNVSPTQAKLIADIKIEQKYLNSQSNSSQNPSNLTNALRRTKDYNESLGNHLYEQGMVNWRFRCIPNDKGLELSLGVGTSRLIVPNDYGITAACDVLVNAKVNERIQVLGVENGSRLFLRIKFEDLIDFRMERIISEAKDGKLVLCIAIPLNSSN